MNTTMAPVITVDGPSGSGKGTLARWLSRQLGWSLLDSGALYRIVAILAQREGAQPDSDSDIQRMADRARSMRVEFLANDADDETILLEGADVTAEVREEATGGMASAWAPHPAIRQALLEFQHACRRLPGLVADGRDMGTVVFPDAPLKLYVTASAEERARRRVGQLREIGVEATIDRICSEIEARDHRDMNREVAPLRPAEDALIIDTTEMGIDEVRAKVLDLAAQFQRQ